MGVRKHETRGSARTSLKSLALLAFVLALGLLGWRAMTVLTAPQGQIGGSALERTTLSLVETVTGPGHARVSVTHGAGGKTWLILVDGAPGTVNEATMTDLIKAAGQFEAGRDTLSIQQYAFAAGATARPDAAAMAELAVLSLLAAMLGYLAFAPQRVQPVEARTEATTLIEPVAPTLQSAQTQPINAHEATAIASADPAKAATVLREWMKSREGAA